MMRSRKELEKAFNKFEDKAGENEDKTKYGNEHIVHKRCNKWHGELDAIQ